MTRGEVSDRQSWCEYDYTKVEENMPFAISSSCNNALVLRSPEVLFFIKSRKEGHLHYGQVSAHAVSEHAD